MDCILHDQEAPMLVQLVRELEYDDEQRFEERLGKLVKAPAKPDRPE